MYEVVYLSGPKAGAIVALAGGEIAGRSPDCQLEVPDPNVSRNHCRFEFNGSQLKLVDLKSSNGSFVNDQRITEMPLTDGDVVRLGETRMRVQERSSRGDMAKSSVFGFRHDDNADISQSLSMSMIQQASKQPQQQTVEAVTKRLEAVIHVSEQLSTIAKLDDLYGPVIDTLFDVFPQAERGFLMLGDSYEKLTPKSTKTRSGDSNEAPAVSSSLCREALSRREVMIYTDGGDADFDQGMSIVNLNIRSAMVVPLMVKDEILGLMLIDTSDRTRSFNEQDMELAASVCRQVAIAIKNAMLVDQVAEEVKTRGNLMRFLPKPVVDQAVGGELQLELGGSPCHGTIFFADVVGFTRMSEQLEPVAVVAMMNRFFDRMVPCIEGENGAVDKFMGDCIMAFWGIPFSESDSARRAGAAALNMQNALNGLNSLRLENGENALGMGIGFDAGPVVAGNIGSDDRLEYTVLGNTVNTAQRIQSQACANQVLVGEQAWSEMKGFAFGVKMPPVKVKNKAHPVNTFSLRGLITENEIVFHLPVKIGDVVCWLMRRLSDGNFILQHPPGVNLTAHEMVTCMIEVSPINLGTAQVVEELTAQTVDGTLRRTTVRLGDPTIGGMLAGKAMATELGWDEMLRSASASAV